MKYFKKRILLMPFIAGCLNATNGHANSDLSYYWTGKHTQCVSHSYNLSGGGIQFPHEYTGENCNENSHIAYDLPIALELNEETPGNGSQVSIGAALKWDLSNIEEGKTYFVESDMIAIQQLEVLFGIYEPSPPWHAYDGDYRVWKKYYHGYGMISPQKLRYSFKANGSKQGPHVFLKFRPTAGASAFFGGELVEILNFSFREASGPEISTAVDTHNCGIQLSATYDNPSLPNISWTSPENQDYFTWFGDTEDGEGVPLNTTFLTAENNQVTNYEVCATAYNSLGDTSDTLCDSVAVDPDLFTPPNAINGFNKRPINNFTAWEVRTSIIPGVTNYHWEIRSASNGQLIREVDLPANANTVELAPGSYNICVTSSNNCGESDAFCGLVDLANLN